MTKKVCTKVSAINWDKVSETAHWITFGKYKEKSKERIDFALLVKDEMGRDYSYVTCKEMDSASVYWQFGGAFPGTKETLHSFGSLKCMVEWCLGYYERIGFLVENTNSAMLKLAAKVGFKIIGVRNFNNHILLEHLLQEKDYVTGV